MAKRSKKFRVAVEGATTDGRKIERSWLEQMAATYNPETYSAQVNVEHIRGLSPNSDFGTYGKVLSLSTQEDTLTIGGQPQKKLALYAEIEPTDALIQLSKKGQKVHTSIEVRPNFAETNKAGLVGLAITDNPASLGTQVLEFAAANPDASPFKGRKQHPDNLFTEALETTLDFADVAADDLASKVSTGFATALETVLSKFGVKPAGEQQKPEPARQEPPAPAADAAALTAGLTALGEAFKSSIADLSKAFSGEVKTIGDRVGALETRLSTTEAGNQPKRNLATGGDGQAVALTDC